MRDTSSPSSVASPTRCVPDALGGHVFLNGSDVCQCGTAYLVDDAASLAGTPEQTDAPKPVAWAVLSPSGDLVEPASRSRETAESWQRFYAEHYPDHGTYTVEPLFRGSAPPASSDVLTAEIERLKAHRLALAKMAVPVADHPLAGFANPITASHTKALAIRVLEGRADD